MAGDGANDIVAGYSMCGATLANSRLLLDLMELDYLDFEKPWWPDSLIKEATCGGKLYFYNEAPIIMDVRNGKILYQGKTTRETGGVWHAGVTVAGKTGVSGVSWRYGLKGFDLESGKILWTRAQGRDFTYLDAAPVYCGGRIYFKGRKKFFIIDLANGNIIKEADKPAGMETPSIPVVTEKAVIFGSCDGFYAYDKQTLKKIWGV